MNDRVKCNWKQCAHGLAVAHTEGGGCYAGDPFVENCDKFVTNEEWGKRMREKDERVFWIVWREWGPPPTRKHENYNEALNEATRLCEKEGTTFYVLEAVGIVEQRPGPIVHRALKAVSVAY